MMLLLQANSATSQTTGSLSSNSAVTAAFISAGVLLLISIATQVIQYLNNRNINKYNRSVLAEKKVEEQRKEIYKKLNDFYGPFQQYLNKSLELYRIFTSNKPKEFRSLTYFLNPEQSYEGKKIILTENEKVIFAEIIAIGEQMEDLIVTKSGLVDDPILRQDFAATISDATDSTDVVGLEKNGLLALMGAHLLVMRLAFNGKLKGETEVYSKYVFPRSLPDVIERNIVKLKRELSILNAAN